MILVGYGFVGQETYRLLSKYAEPKIIDPDKGYEECYSDNEIYYIAVNPKLDFSELYYVLDKIEDTSNSVAVIESTLSLEALDKIEQKYSFPIIYVPERVQPAGKKATARLYSVVTSSIDRKDIEEALKPFMNEYDLIKVPNPADAVVSKLVENAYRYFQIAFSNLVANSFDSRIIDYVNTHQNVSMMQPGIGIGGLCLEKDTQFLLDALHGDARRSLGALLDYGKSIPEQIANEIHCAVLDIAEANSISEIARKFRLSLFGKAYKADTNITTNSKALEIAEILRKRGIEVLHYDPLVDSAMPKEFLDSDCLVILVPHKGWQHYKNVFHNYMVIDAKELF